MVTNIFMSVRCFLFTMLVLPLFAITVSAETESLPIGVDAMTNVQALPILAPYGTQTKQFVSYDITGKNRDGNFEHAFTKYIDKNGEHVIFDDYGPGCLYRQQLNIWITDPPDPNEGKGDARIRYYFDDETTPRIDMHVIDFFEDPKGIFGKPFNHIVRLDMPNPPCVGREGIPFALSYHPFPFAKRLKVTIVPTKNWMPTDYCWYQYTYIAYPPGTKVTSWVPDKKYDVTRLKQQWAGVGTDPKPTEGNQHFENTLAVKKNSRVNLFDHQGQGSISSLKLQLNPYSRELFFKTRIRIYWDSLLTPAIDMPLGVFFGSGGEAYESCLNIQDRVLKNLLFGYDGSAHTFYCYWPMPFWESARIEIDNQSDQDITELKASIEVKPREAYNYDRNHTGYFHAMQTRYTSKDTMEPYAPVFAQTGRGHIVARTMFSNEFDCDGDEFTYFDDSQTPQIHGDGIEDDHNQGWGGRSTQEPLWGGLFSGYHGAYRIFLGDRYIFNTSVKMNYEITNVGQFADKPHHQTDVTVYYYKTSGKPQLHLTDTLDVGNKMSEEAHHYTVNGQKWYGKLCTKYDEYEKTVYNIYNRVVVDEGRAFDKYSEFSVTISPKNQGVKLRKRISRCGNNIQKAAVYVDGVLVDRPWYVVNNYAVPGDQAWMDIDFEIPALYTQGKSNLQIRVKYNDSPQKGLVNEFYYWVYNYIKSTE